MTPVAYIFSSEDISDLEFKGFLEVIGADSESIIDASPGILFRGDSTVWLEKVNAEYIGYEEKELQAVENKLGGSVCAFFTVEYFANQEGIDLLVDCLARMNERWPIIFDDGHGAFRTFDELKILVAICN
jgi:hypothetical protein